jgi:hypothetical protein
MPKFLGAENTITQHLYDTILLPIGAVGGTFFTVPFGGLLVAGIAKNNRHTNLLQASRLESGVYVDVDSISMHLPQTPEAGALPLQADVRAVFSGNIRIVFGGVREFLRLPAAMIPCGGANFTFFSNIAPAATEYYLSNGVPATQNRLSLMPFRIEEGETIQVVLENCDAMTAATEVTFVFWGQMNRPVG